MRPLRVLLAVAVCLSLGHPAYAGPAAAADPSNLAAWQQTPPPTTTPKPTPTPTPTPTPDSLERIRDAMNREPALKLDSGQFHIYVEVIAKWPSFVEATRAYDLMNGPTGLGNPMSHREFVNMMTPQEMVGSGGVQAPEVLTMALVNYFGQKLIKKGIKQIGEARTDKEIRDIRARIDAELAALRGGK